MSIIWSNKHQRYIDLDYDQEEDYDEDEDVIGEPKTLKQVWDIMINANKELKERIK